MFKPTAAAKIHDERVILHREPAEDLRAFFDDLGHVDTELFEIVIPIAVQYDPVRDAAYHKGCLDKIADLEWRVIQNVEVRGLECIGASGDSGESGRDLPATERFHSDLRRRAYMPVWKHQERSIIPKRMSVIQLIRS